jgi:polar amino acid transport system substrate-binding protein
MVRLAALACCLALTSVPCRAGTITLGADEWFPYNGTPGAAREGYIVDIARAVAATGGDTIAYRTYDWETTIARVRAGTDDCAIGATAEDGPGLVLSSQPVGRSVSAFFVRRETAWRYAGSASLETIRLAAIAGYQYGAEVDAWIASAPPGRVQVVHNSRRALRSAFGLLLTRQVDALIEDVVVVRALADEMGVRDRVVEAGTVPGALDLYLACSPTKRGRQLAQRFGDGIRQLRDSGELARIMARYGLEDWLLAR